MPEGVTWLQDHANAIDADQRLVTTAGGLRIGFDFLVVATGVEPHWTAIPGLAESVGQPGTGVCSNYSYDTVASIWAAIQAVRGGTAIFTEPITPVKCGEAPQKIMYLAEEAFHRHGIRDRMRVLFVNAKATLFTSPYYVPPLEKVIQDRGIGVRLGQELVALQPASKQAAFRSRDTGDEQIIGYEMIHVTPPQGPRRFSERAHWSIAPAGWKSTNTRCSTSAIRAYSAWAIPVTCRPRRPAQPSASRPRFWSRTSLRFVRVGTATAASDGYTSRPLVTGRGKLILTEFGYDKTPMESFP